LDKTDATATAFFQVLAIKFRWLRMLRCEL
jgi:hypothetical protein